MWWSLYRTGIGQAGKESGSMFLARRAAGKMESQAPAGFDYDAFEGTIAPLREERLA